MLARPRYLEKIRKGLRRSPAVALVGPRQCGKTTLARAILEEGSDNYFDLENPRDSALLENPMALLESLRGVVVIDEIQRMPELFPVLRVLCDRKPLRARFLVLGSASPALMQQAGESLAGRIEVQELTPFLFGELDAGRKELLWLRGGFPRSLLSRSSDDSFTWRGSFVRTILDRDMRFFGVTASSVTMERLWRMLATMHGNVWNAADPARSLGIGETTVRRYLDLLGGLFLVRQLPPWHENLGKRQVKSPKIYIRDSGLLHWLLDLPTRKTLLRHVRLGASWEGYALEQILSTWQPDQAYFWATHAGAELDLLVFRGNKRIGVEFKMNDNPGKTASMEIARADLKLDRLIVVYPGMRTYSPGKGIEVMPLSIALAQYSY